MDKIILGIDPGIVKAGYAVIISRNGKFCLADIGVFKQSSSQSVCERVTNFHNFFLDKILKHKINVISLETPFLGKNAQTFLKLGYLRGVLNLLAGTHNCQLLELSPRQVKQNITGSGAAEKDQVAKVLAMMFPGLHTLTKDFSQDSTDALAVCLSGAMNLG